MGDSLRDKSEDEIRHLIRGMEEHLVWRAHQQARAGGEAAMVDESSVGGGSLRLPGGSGASWRGWGGIIGILVIVFAGALGGLLWINERGFAVLEARDQDRIKAIKETAAARAEQTTRMAEEHRDIGESLESVIYVLTLPEAERTKLRLKMPRRLQEMERR